MVKFRVLCSSLVHEFDLASDATVLSVKELLRQRTGIPRSLQLFDDGSRLTNDADTLLGSQIAEGSTLTLSKRQFQKTAPAALPKRATLAKGCPPLMAASKTAPKRNIVQLHIGGASVLEGVSAKPPPAPPKKRAKKASSGPPVIHELEPHGDGIAVGLDEAGKGCVLGPMPIGIVAWPKSQLQLLVDKKVRDSKTVKPQERGELRRWIREKALYQATVVCSAAELCDFKSKGLTINQVEHRLFAQAIESLPTSIEGPIDLYLDAADVDANRFGRLIMNLLSPETKKRIRSVVSEHKADNKYRVVGAASIVAKEEREDWIRFMHTKPGMQFGDGYQTDPRTIEWLKAYYRTHRKWPNFCRHYWETCSKIERVVIGEEPTSGLLFLQPPPDDPPISSASDNAPPRTDVDAGTPMAVAEYGDDELCPMTDDGTFA